MVYGLKISEFKDILWLATKRSYFRSNYILYKQINIVAMWPPFGPSLANTFLANHE